MINEVLKEWYVECAVTGKQILLADIRYWDVDKQIVYASSDVAFQVHERERLIKS